MNLILRAQAFAHAAHDSIGQKRKYSGKPYWVHTDYVATKVASVTDDEEVIAAAHLHDYLEDVVYRNLEEGISFLTEQFGARVTKFVIELTDVYTKEAYPHLVRKERKALELTRKAKISPEAKTIKLADIIDNTRDIVKNDPNFAKVYLREINDVLPYLSEGNNTLFHAACHTVAAACYSLDIIP